MNSRNVSVLLLLICSPALLAQGTWQVVGQMPRPVSSGEAIVYDSSIIVLGGQDHDSVFRTVDWVQVYRPNEQSWQLVGSLRRPRRDFIGDRDSSYAYIVGGRRGGMGGVGDSTLEALNLSQLPTGYYLDINRFFARLSPAGAIHNGFLYIVGGFRLPGIPFLLEYDLNSRTITYHRDTSLQAVGQMAARIGNDIYLFGGEVFNTITNKIWRFNVISRTFQELPPSTRLQAPRAFGKAVRLGNQNRILIVGGRNEAGALNSVEIFEVLPGSPPTYRITQGPPNIFRRVSCMAVYFDGFVYLLGGAHQNHSVRPIERYNVSTSVPGDFGTLVTEYALLQNYPNPFNSSTNLRILIPRRGTVTLKVFNILGSEVATIFGGTLTAGKYEFTWDALDLPSGIYLYQLRSGSFQDTKKMILLR